MEIMVDFANGVQPSISIFSSIPCVHWNMGEMKVW